MTDPTDPHSPAERGLETRLRASLAARAASARIDADEEDLRRRIEGRADLSLAASGHRLRWPNPLLRAAAALVVLAAIATVAVVATRPDRPDPVVRTDPGSATGWYIPTDLPAGWTVEQISVSGGGDLIERRCPCTNRTWGSSDGSRVVSSSTDYQAVDGPAPARAAVVDLGHGVQGAWADADHAERWRSGLAWTEGHDRTVVYANDAVGRAGLVSAARRLVTDHAGPPAADLVLRASAREPRAIVQSPRIQLGVRTGRSGASLSATLSPAWTASTGQLGNDVLREARWGPYLAPPDGQEEPAFIGLFPDAAWYVTYGSLRLPGKGNGSKDAGGPAYERFLRSLRPATAEEWAAFVRSIPGHDDELLAPTLDDLMTPLPKAPPSHTTTTSAPSTTRRAPAGSVLPSVSSTTTDGGLPIVSSVVRSFPNGIDEGPDYTDLDELRFGLAVGGTSVQAGQDLFGQLVVENPTEHLAVIKPCTGTRTFGALVPEAEQDRTILFEDLSCEAETLHLPPHSSRTIDIPIPGRGSGWSARSGPGADGAWFGTLGPGRYRPMVQISGRRTTIRVTALDPITVLADPCGGYSDDLAIALLSRPSTSEARTVARRFGLHVTVASVDRIGRNLPFGVDCHRLLVDVEHGEVVHYRVA